MQLPGHQLAQTHRKILGTLTSQCSLAALLPLLAHGTCTQNAAAVQGLHIAAREIAQECSSMLSMSLDVAATCGAFAACSKQCSSTTVKLVLDSESGQAMKQKCATVLQHCKHGHEPAVAGLSLLALLHSMI